MECENSTCMAWSIVPLTNLVEINKLKSQDLPTQVTFFYGVLYGAHFVL